MCPIGPCIRDLYTKIRSHINSEIFVLSTTCIYPRSSTTNQIIQSFQSRILFPPPEFSIQICLFNSFLVKLLPRSKIFQKQELSFPKNSERTFLLYPFTTISNLKCKPCFQIHIYSFNTPKNTIATTSNFKTSNIFPF